MTCWSPHREGNDFLVGPDETLTFAGVQVVMSSVPAKCARGGSLSPRLGQVASARAWALCVLLASACSEGAPVSPQAGGAGGSSVSGAASSGAAAGVDASSAGAQLGGAAGSGAQLGGAAGNAGGVAPAGSGGSGGDAQAGAPPANAPRTCVPARPHDAGTTTVKLTFDGKARDYVVHVPPAYDGAKALPMVVDFHGYTSWATEQLERTKWGELADSEGFIVLEPDGTLEGNGESRSWNVELCCGVAQQQAVNDVGFIRHLVGQLESELCVDPKRVYATGHSNGAAMTFLLACQAADLFAAVAPVCGATLQPMACHPARPIAVAMIRAKGDDAVPYQGKPDWQSAAADFALWQGLNQCATTPLDATLNGVCESYTECAAGTSVMLCSPRGGHGFFYRPEENLDHLLVPDTAWPFFKQFSLP